MAKSRKGGLGRGLNSLINDPSVKTEVKEKVIARMIPVGNIRPNKYQPRTEFDPTELENLVDSIKVHGIIQPLTVKHLKDDQYELISGERRLRASKLADLKEVPAYIRTANDEQMLEMALIENIQRQDLNPIEVANSYNRLITELKISQEKVGEKVGKNRTSVTNYLRLLELPESIRKSLSDGQISFGHGRVLAGIKNEDKLSDIFQEIVTNNISVRQAEALKKSWENDEVKEEKKVSPTTAHEIQVRDVEKQLVDKLGSKVKLAQDEKTGKGKISIPFGSTDDLNRILEILDVI